MLYALNQKYGSKICCIYNHAMTLRYHATINLMHIVYKAYFTQLDGHEQKTVKHLIHACEIIARPL